jgi:hypothetical protein
LEIDPRGKHNKKFPNNPGSQYEKKEARLKPNPKTAKIIAGITGNVSPFVDFDNIDFPY